MATNAWLVLKCRLGLATEKCMGMHITIMSQHIRQCTNEFNFGIFRMPLEFVGIQREEKNSANVYTRIYICLVHQLIVELNGNLKTFLCCSGAFFSEPRFVFLYVLPLRRCATCNRAQVITLMRIHVSMAASIRHSK